MVVMARLTFLGAAGTGKAAGATIRSGNASREAHERALHTEERDGSVDVEVL